MLASPPYFPGNSLCGSGRFEIVVKIALRGDLPPHPACGGANVASVVLRIK